MVKITNLDLLDDNAVDGTELMPVVKGGKSWRARLSALAAPMVAAATAARDAAQGFFNSTQAIAATLPYALYASTAAAQADTSLISGHAYTVVSGSQILIYSKTSGTASNLIGIIPTQSYVDRLKNRSAIPTLDFGAYGDGQHAVADQAGFAAAIAAANSSVQAPIGTNEPTRTQIGIVLEPGIYDAGGFNFAGSPINIRARVPYTVCIRIPAGQYFATHSGNPTSAVVDGIVFTGGLGVYKNTNTATNISWRVEFTNCGLHNYTEAGIYNSAQDSPALHVKNCRFGGGMPSGNQVIGICWGGFVDQSIIEDCYFGGNTYHIAIGPRIGSHLTIQRCYFQSGNDTTVPRCKADIWLKPNITDGETNSGQNSIITNNRFGGELLDSGYPVPRILIANENTASGTSRAQYTPATNDAGDIAGFKIFDNHVGSVSPFNAPFIRSYISNVRYFDVRKNTFVGGTLTMLIEFPNGRSVNYSNNNNLFELDDTSAGAPLRLSNVAVGRLEDKSGIWLGDVNAVQLVPVSDDPLITPVAVALSGYEMAYGSGTTSVAVADPYGTTDYAAVTGLTVLGFTDPYAGAGGAMFVEVSLSKAASNSLSYVTVDVVNYQNSYYAFKRTVALPANGSPAKLAVPVYLPAHASPGTWQFRIYGSNVVAGSADTFVAGDMIVSKGNGRLGRDRALASRFPLASRNPRLTGGAAGTVPTHWIISTNGLYGITVTVNRVGVDRYGYFVEVAFSGTCTTAGTAYIYTEVSKAMCLESGNAWRGLFPMRLMSGDFSAMTTASGYDGSSGPVSITFPCYNSSGTWQLQRGIAVTPTSAYKAFGRTFNSGFFHSAADYTQPALGFGFAVGAAPTAVVRIYAPVLQRVQ